MTPEGSNPSEAEGALRRLEERLDRASAAAERLMAEAARAAGTASGTAHDPEPPPSGWQVPDAEAEQRGDGDLEALIALARWLRDLLDWYLERLDRQRAEPAEVQDIPIL